MGCREEKHINISGIAFTCDYAAPISISTAAYTSSATGIMTVTTSSAHGFNPTGKSSVVIFTGLGMTCAIDSGVSTHYYPRGTGSMHIIMQYLLLLQQPATNYS